MDDHTSIYHRYFNPVIVVEDSPSKTSSIRIHNRWVDQFNGIRFFRMRLTGTDPITGKNVEQENADNLITNFSFDKQHFTFQNLLYYGDFQLETVAVLYDNTEVEMPSRPVKLRYERNKPIIHYTTKETGNGLTLLTIRSNCLKGHNGKIWLRYGQHLQMLRVPPDAGSEVRWYIPTSQEISLEVTNKLTEVIKDKR